MKDLQRLRAFQTRARIFGNDHIIGLGMKLFAALRQVQNEVGVHGELGFFEFFETAVYDLCIAMDEKNAKRMAFVRHPALRAGTRQIRSQIVLGQARHGSTLRQPRELTAIRVSDQEVDPYSSK